jgi:GNAT superfamily N-acetyltransferase
MSDHEIASYDRNDCLLCRRNGIVLGQVNVRDLRDESLGGYVIWGLLVFPDHRNHGVGDALIQCVLRTYQDAPVFITAEPFYDNEGLNRQKLLDWYHRLGFQVWQDESNVGDKWLRISPK